MKELCSIEPTGVLNRLRCWAVSNGFNSFPCIILLFDLNKKKKEKNSMGVAHLYLYPIDYPLSYVTMHMFCYMYWYIDNAPFDISVSHFLLLFGSLVWNIGVDWSLFVMYVSFHEDHDMVDLSTLFKPIELV